MTLRLDSHRANRLSTELLIRMDRRNERYRLEHSLADLVRLRVSQVNGCPYCIDLHSARARKDGEMAARIDMLEVWRETPLYTDRERAALAWAEAVTDIAGTHVPDAVWEAARPYFSEREIVDLTLLVTAVNSLNRFGIAFRRSPV
ncbi:carboxymuconolactone decarboxylase family protein [Cupriavidus basilensis]|uniref:carboxymuconolactone decarboxylase family protein n=1 Tax=Cupriavidus basilensis TaxID=68895 RepID=UPI0023E7F907|nr:carboxymuconolactone decarboxylase family protein [Cupriavidus basilensis]MDF3882007.1 carboxymuconolactone decarboxylase family protein [Cupriavidus basilensis]